MERKNLRNNNKFLYFLLYISSEIVEREKERAQKQE